MDNHNNGANLGSHVRKFITCSSSGSGYGLAVSVSSFFLLSAFTILIMSKSPNSFISTPVFLGFNNPFSSNSSLPNKTHHNLRNSSSECDIFDGKWEKDYTLPYYPPGSCPLIDRAFNCRNNGRPDQEFYSWSWRPNECNIPRLNASDFLERLRGKRLVFVGDSLNRNMWESLVCILRHSIQNKETVYEISGRKEFNKEGFGSFRFEDFNCSIDYVTSPFLVMQSKISRKNGSFPTLRLDLMDKTSEIYRDAHVLVFNTGHWWSHEKTSRGENYYQEGNHVYDKLDGVEAYRRALTTWGEWVDTHVDTTKTLVFFRGYSIAHFSGGQWNSGGQCHKEREPADDDIINGRSYAGKYPTKMIALESVLNKMKTPVIYLNVTRLTDSRKDAHPSIYRKSHKTAEELTKAEQSQDCSHWCLPGVPDTWNHLFYASLVKAGWGSH